MEEHQGFPDWEEEAEKGFQEPRALVVEVEHLT